MYVNICLYSFSPVIRKYMSELESGLEKKFMEMLQRNLLTFIPSQTPAPASIVQNQTPFPSSMRQEIKSIMKEVLCESPIKTNVKCQLVRMYIIRKRNLCLSGIIFNSSTQVLTYSKYRRYQKQAAPHLLKHLVLI